MRRLSITKVSPRMLLAKGIYTTDGRVLLPAGAVLSELYIKRLQKMGLKYLFVRDEDLQEVEIKELVSDMSIIELQLAIKVLYNKISKGQVVDFEPVKEALDNLVYEVVANRNHLGNHFDWSHGDPLINHSINVCILSLMMGIRMDYNLKQLDQLALGALLHDIGKTLIDNPEKDSHFEHTREGFIFLRENGSVPLLSAHVAFQHHENWDGTGLPRRISKEDINEYARIVGIADTYDKMIREQDVFPCDASVRLANMAGKQLDPDLVNLFTRIVPTYPLGTTVQLSNRQKAIVIDVPPECPSRPVVWMMSLNQQEKALNLAESPHIDVTAVLI